MLTIIRFRQLCSLAILVGAALASAPSAASTITLNGTGAMTYTYQFLWSNPGSPTISNDYSLAVPGQYTFSDSFTSQQPATTNLGTDPVGPYDFQDSYRFTISTGASGDTLVTSLGLGGTFSMSDLQFRLYEVPTSTTAPIVGGVPPGSTVITAWQAAGTASFSGLMSGTYILDVAGIASGTSGGTYVGQLNLSPTTVPLPAGLPLLLSGLGGLWAMARRRGARSPVDLTRTAVAG